MTSPGKSSGIFRKSRWPHNFEVIPKKNAQFLNIISWMTFRKKAGSNSITFFIFLYNNMVFLPSYLQNCDQKIWKMKYKYQITTYHDFGVFKILGNKFCRHYHSPLIIPSEFGLEKQMAPDFWCDYFRKRIQMLFLNRIISWMEISYFS